MASRSRILPTLVAALGVVAALAASAGAAGSYDTDTTGVVNVQASTTPLFQPCPSGAPWLRDPAVCASRWSAFANDKSESDLAVDPTNPNHIVGMSKAFFSPKDYLFELVWYDSTDGGQTWKSGILPGYDEWMDTTDPVVAFDSQGNLYALVLPFNFVIEPSGDHNWDVGHVSPQGLNDAIYLSRSLKSDGPVGQKWQPPVLLATYHASGLGITADKQWVGADTFGEHPGSVYASWIVFDGAALNTVVSVSTDHGAHFTPPQVVSSATKPKFNGDPYVFEGPEGNVYVGYDTLPPKQSYTSGGFQAVVSHDNGQTWSKPGQQVTTSVGPTPYVPDTFRDGTPYSMTVNPARTTTARCRRGTPGSRSRRTKERPGRSRCRSTTQPRPGIPFSRRCSPHRTASSGSPSMTAGSPAQPATPFQPTPASPTPVSTSPSSSTPRTARRSVATGGRRSRPGTRTWHRRSPAASRARKRSSATTSAAQ